MGSSPARPGAGGCLRACRSVNMVRGVGGQGQGGQQVEERAVHRAVGRLLRRGVARRSAAAPSLSVSAHVAEAHTMPRASGTNHTRGAAAGPRGQAGWPLSACASALPLPGSAWLSLGFPPSHRRASRNAPSSGGFVNTERRPRLLPGKAPFPAVTVLLGANGAMGALDLGGGGGAGCGRGPLKSSF